MRRLLEVDEAEAGDAALDRGVLDRGAARAGDGVNVMALPTAGTQRASYTGGKGDTASAFLLLAASDLAVGVSFALAFGEAKAVFDLGDCFGLCL